MSNALDKLIEHYQTLHIPEDYFRVVRGLRDRDGREYMQDPSFLYGIQGMQRPGYTPPGKASAGDIRTDVPMWFGDLDSAKLKVCVVGSETRDTDSAFGPGARLQHVSERVATGCRKAEMTETSRWSRRTRSRCLA